jgi:hypothetical protein
MGQPKHQAGVKWWPREASYETENKKIVIEHLYKAIATMRSQQDHNSEKGQSSASLKREYGISVPNSLHKTLGRRIREFEARQN